MNEILKQMHNLIDAAEEYAQNFNDDDREGIKADIMNAFFAGSKFEESRRAKPEGEAPQASLHLGSVASLLYIALNDAWQGGIFVDDEEKTVRAALSAYNRYRSSPAPAAQHAESGAPVVKAAQALLDCCDGLPIETDEATVAELTAFDRTRAALRKALAAQSQGAPDT